MAVMLGDLDDRMSRYPARDAEYEAIEILVSQHLERMRDITLLVVGHGIYRDRLYSPSTE